MYANSNMGTKRYMTYTFENKANCIKPPFTTSWLSGITIQYKKCILVLHVGQPVALQCCAHHCHGPCSCASPYSTKYNFNFQRHVVYHHQALLNNTKTLPLKIHSNERHSFAMSNHEQVAHCHTQRSHILMKGP